MNPVVETWQGKDVVFSYGDVSAEVQAIQKHAALVDRSERETIVALGNDVVPLLQGLVTHDLFSLAAPGSGLLTTVVNLKGRMISDLRVLHLLDVLILDLEPGQIKAGVVAHFKNHVITEDAKFLDRSPQTARLGLFGPESAMILERAGSFDTRLDKLQVYGGTTGRIGADEVVAQYVPITGSLGFEIYADIDAKERIERQILRNSPTLMRAGHLAVEHTRVESGLPRFGVELDESTIPLEADMNYAISYNKGCYLGQEVIARLDSRGVPAKMLRYLHLDSERSVEPGTPVKLDDSTVGEVKSSVFSERFGHAVAMAYLKRNHNDIGLRVRVGDQEATVHGLPGLLPNHFPKVGTLHAGSEISK